MVSEGAVADHQAGTNTSGAPLVIGSNDSKPCPPTLTLLELAPSAPDAVSLGTRCSSGRHRTASVPSQPPAMVVQHLSRETTNPAEFSGHIARYPPHRQDRAGHRWCSRRNRRQHHHLDHLQRDDNLLPPSPSVPGPFRASFWIVCLTAISAVAISVEFCILIGVFLSFLFYVPRAARIHMTELVLAPERVVRERISSDPPCGRIRIFSLEGEFFFGAAPELEDHFEKIAALTKEGIRVVVLRVKRARNPDPVCLAVLERFIDRMDKLGASVLLCGIRPDFMRIIEAGGLVRRLGPNRVFVFQETGAVWSSTLEAIRFAYELLKGDVCAICPRYAESLEGKEGWYYMI